MIIYYPEIQAIEHAEHAKEFKESACNQQFSEWWDWIVERINLIEGGVGKR